VSEAIDAAISVLRDLYPLSLNCTEITFFALQKRSWCTKSKTAKLTMDARINTYIIKNRGKDARISRTGSDLFSYNPDTQSLWVEKKHDPVFVELLQALRRVIELNFVIGILDEYHQNSRGSVPPVKDCHILALKGAAVVFAVGAWEFFNQELVLDASRRLRKELSKPRSRFDYNKLPKGLLRSVRDSLYKKYFPGIKSLPVRKFWEKSPVQNNANLLTEYHKIKVLRYNNPDAKSTGSLMFRCFSIRDIGSRWSISGYSNKSVCQSLDEYVSIRHHLAHGENDQRLKKVSLEEMTKRL